MTAWPIRAGSVRGGFLALLSLVPVACHEGSAPSPPLVADPDPKCQTLAAVDGREPPCNPHLGSSVWSSPHRNSYAQGSSPLPGPRSAEGLRYRRSPLSQTSESATIFSITEPYPDGGRAIWYSSTSVPQSYAVYKLDYDSLEVLGRQDIRDEGGRPQPVGTTSGVYNLLLRDNRLVSLRERRIGIYRDAQPGERRSPIELEQALDLPAAAFCRDSDRLVGVTLLYSGELAYASAQGVVGVLPVPASGLRAEALRSYSLNGAQCQDPAIADEALEQVSNSISADEDGGIYVVSDRAMYRVDAPASGALRLGWRAEYQTGGGGGGTTLSSGSGSTPDVMGTGADRDRFVVITDGQSLMHLVLFWRDRIPEDWQPIAPGRDRRIACEFPVTFGDPAATASISEQSVLTRGYSAVVVNNVLALDPVLRLLPDLGINQVLALTGQLPGNQPRGVERIDWDPVSRRCRSVWSNPEASIPNGVPTLSAATRMVYGLGVRNGIWGLLALDFDRGEERFFLPSSPLPTDNSFFAATTVGPDGDIVTGLLCGIGIFTER